MNLMLRPASEAPFPYGWPGRVVYATVSPDGEVRQAPRTKAEFRDVVRSALSRDVQMIAAWPGEWRTDMFVIDDPAALARAIGLAEAGS